MLRCAAADWAGREDACRREMRCRRHPPSRRHRALAQIHTHATHESPPVVAVVAVVRRPLLASAAGLIQIRIQIQIQIHPSSRRPVAAHASRQSVLLAHTFRVNQPTSLCFRRSLAPLGATARGGLSPFFRPPSPVPASVPGLDCIGPLVRPWRPAQHPRSSAAPESHAFAVPLHLIKSTESNRSSTHREPRGAAFLVPYRAVPYEPQSIGNREPASDQCGLFVYLRPRRPA
ncbi:hypothetical protein VFPFJ_03352 [Purpureocillium lilacinum]|uniref:Uncharacterized protein n=1 Tax=Purpureocillium lilacinum TaxID=33203 RepID=A0A179HP27_PURLI|nr:hypothetical protein VFPFJ_03352 [Purpureocillium lilacinum]OAQ91612.1 hypothetical protein VFPFJ_03352 [Purpureocillium lilacinum]